MCDINNKSTAELQALLTECHTTLGSLLESLESRPDMQKAMRRLAGPEDMLELFSELAVDDPDIMRAVLQMCVAVVANTQCIRRIDAELEKRAGRN